MARPFRLSYIVTGDERVEHDMLGIADRVDDLRPAWRRVADLMREFEAELFETEGHGEWDPLADSTIENKQALGYDPSILIATGELVTSLTESGGHNVEIVSDDELHFSTTVPYAGFHKTGTSNMPKRDPLTFDRNQVREFTREVQRYLVGAERAAGVGGSSVPFGTGIG